MTSVNQGSGSRRLYSALLVGTIISGLGAPAFAQPQAAAPAPAPASTPPAAAAAPAPASAPTTAAQLIAPQVTGTIRAVAVTGNQRLEPETVLSYTSLRVGEPYTRERLDQALKDLYATELFADVQIRDNQGALTIEVRENPVINRIILEGNKRIKEDKINPEIKLAPRQIFTRSKVRADVARIIELYRRQGRFAATVDPKIVQLDQNRVDVVFEINEGAKSKVRQINILGNDKFSDSRLRSEMATKEARIFNLFSSNDSYDPDRLAFDQQKMRQFYLTQGYADFRVISAVAELTPDKKDFIITYVVEEGKRYKYGKVDVQSQIRDLNADQLKAVLPMHTGDWFNAKQVEDTITALNERAGLFGYAFADVDTDYDHDKNKLTMGVTFKIAEAPRVYVERVDINGNTNTRDKVIRREFRLAEGDPFNSIAVKRSKERIQSLGYFQDKLEIEQTPGSTPDRVVLGVNVEDKATGELQVSAGYSSLERFLVNLSVTQRNFMGKGQTLQTSVDYSTYSKSVELGFTEPYVFDKNIAMGVDVFRRDYNSFNYINGNDRNTTYEQVTTGFQIRSGLALTEFWSLALRYGLSYDQVSLDKATFYTDPDDAGPLPAACDPLLAGRYLCDAIGNRTTSSVGYSLVYDSLNNRLHPSSGTRFLLQQDFAGLGGSVKYIRTRVSANKYWAVGSKGFILSASAEGGYIHSLEGKRIDSAGNEIDPVRLTDRFFLGEPQIRGFDIRGVGPRVLREPFQTDADGNYIKDANGNYVPGTDRSTFTDDALGGRAYYLAHLELEIPLGASGRELGLRPSIFVDVGAVFGLKNVITQEVLPGDPRLSTTPILSTGGNYQCSDNTSGAITEVPVGSPCPDTSTLLQNPAKIAAPFTEKYLGDTPKPRVSVGFGVNWNSPFGPFRIDVAKALVTAPGDDPKLITFNVGTQF